MEFDPRDQDIITLLAKLKDVNTKYPENMLVARRQSYLKQMAEIGLGLSGGAEIKNAVKNTKPPHIPPVTGTLLESALLVVILVEASAMAYFYREKLADFFQTFTTASRAEETTPPPTFPTALQVQGVSPSPAITSTTMAGTAETTVTSTSTPIPGMMSDNSSNTPGVNSLNSTPDPKGNNGNHYGQTPKPQRTKENNGNKDKPPKDNNDKPPKDEPKPTKAK